jgi:hypothetical protein
MAVGDSAEVKAAAEREHATEGEIQADKKGV